MAAFTISGKSGTRTNEGGPRVDGNTGMGKQKAIPLLLDTTLRALVIVMRRTGKGYLRGRGTGFSTGDLLVLALFRLENGQRVLAGSCKRNAVEP